MRYRAVPGLIGMLLAASTLASCSSSTGGQARGLDAVVDDTAPSISSIDDGAPGEIVVGGCRIAPKAQCPGANLSGANLSNANLAGANLSGANLSATNLTGANLSGANLSKANVSGTTFTRANLSGAKWVNGRVCAQGSIKVCK